MLSVAKRSRAVCSMLFVKFTRSFNQWRWVRASVAQQSAHWPIPLIVSIRRNYVCALPMDAERLTPHHNHNDTYPHLLPRVYTFFCCSELRHEDASCFLIRKRNDCNYRDTNAHQLHGRSLFFIFNAISVDAL